MLTAHDHLPERLNAAPPLSSSGSLPASSSISLHVILAGQRLFSQSRVSQPSEPQSAVREAETPSRAGEMLGESEHLLSKHGAVSSNPQHQPAKSQAWPHVPGTPGDRQTGRQIPDL